MSDFPGPPDERVLSEIGGDVDIAPDGCVTFSSDHSLEGTLAFLLFCLFLCCVLEHANLLFGKWNLPISVVMYVVGTIVGILNLHVLGAGYTVPGLVNLFDGLMGAATFDPHALLYVILPPLLYESASSMSWRVLRKILPSALLLAVPGVLLNTIFTGFYVKLAVVVQGGSPSWQTAWLLSSILSATDPVAVVAALSKLGAPDKLASLVEGESLLNDGSAVVVTYVMRDWVMGDAADDSEKFCPGSPPAAGCIIGYVIQVAVGGSVIGVLAGFIVSAWLKRARAQYMTHLEIAIILTSIYGTFFVAEALSTSGVLAVVTLGFMMSAHVMMKLSTEGRHAHHVVVSQISYACNQITFFAAGIISARFMWNWDCNLEHSASHVRAWLELAGLYVVVHITRASVVFIFSPLLRRMGYGITWKEATILVYGGLRGAVGLVMSLIVEHNAHIDASISQMIAFHTSGIVLLTLLVNGSTVDVVYRRLKIYPINTFRRTYLRKVLHKLEDQCQNGDVKQISADWFFNDCEIRTLLRCVPNFSYVEFNDAGVPHPAGITSTLKVLQEIETRANEYQLAHLFAHKGSFEDVSFEDRWQRRKREEPELEFSDIVLEHETGFENSKDDFNNIRTSEEGGLHFSAPHGKSIGQYLSVRPLAAIAPGVGGEGEGDTGFAVTLRQLSNVRVLVGLVAGGEAAPRLADAGSSLGVWQNSIGFDLDTYGVIYSCGEGCQRHDTLAEFDVPAKFPERGEVAVNVSRKPGQEWEVAFTATGPGFPASTISVGFGHFAPGELYPMIEFQARPKFTRGSSMGSMESSASRASFITRAISAPIKSETSGRGNSPEQQETSGHRERKGQFNNLSIVPAAPSGHPPGIAQQADEVDSPTSPVSPGGMCAVRSVSFNQSGTFGKAFPLPHTSDLSSGDSSTPSGAGQFPETETVDRTATVQLSFEPVVNTDAESISELFNVLYNTIQSKYNEFHHRGVLGDTALCWLTEAVGEAMDRASSEVNALTAECFERKKKSMMTRVQRSSIHLVSARRTSLEEPPTTTEPTRGSIFSFNHPPAPKKPVGLFEPILVEYMSLEQQVSIAPRWDHMPQCWERLRQYGYGHTQAKVEALWIFCLAHEKVIKNSPTLERFPKLLKCIKRVVSRVKRDLQILRELEPRRYFYAKHILALRFIMNRRLEKVIKFAEEGWVTQADGEGLINALQERIVQTDQYSPALGTRADLKRCHHHTTSVLQAPVAAWRDLELPDYSDERRGSADSRAGGPSRKRASVHSAASEKSAACASTGSANSDASARSGYSLATSWWMKRVSVTSKITDPTESVNSSKSSKWRKQNKSTRN